MTGPDITLGEITESNEPEANPEPADQVRHFFLSDGMSWQEFRETPLPIIFGVLEEQIRLNKEREEEHGS